MNFTTHRCNGKGPRFKNTPFFSIERPSPKVPRQLTEPRRFGSGLRVSDFGFRVSGFRVHGDFAPASESLPQGPETDSVFRVSCFGWTACSHLTQRYPRSAQPPRPPRSPPLPNRAPGLSLSPRTCFWTGPQGHALFCTGTRWSRPVFTTGRVQFTTGHVIFTTGSRTGHVLLGT